MPGQNIAHDGEAPAVVKLGPSLKPVSIIHARPPDLSLIAWETLRSWTISPAGRDRARRTGAVVDRHQVRVAGPAPGRPGDYADYTVIVSRYGGETGWWVRPGPDAWPGHRGGGGQAAQSGRGG